MKRIIFLLILLNTLLLAAEIRNLQIKPSQVEFSITFNTSISEEGEHTKLVYEDKDFWTVSNDTGAPLLPFHTFNIAVPPQGDLTISYQIMEQEEVNLQLPLSPVQTIIPDESTNSFYPIINTQKYNSSTIVPVFKSEAFSYNGYRLIPVSIQPCNYFHESKRLHIYSKIKVKIEIKGNHRWQGKADLNRHWLEEDFILNYNTAKYWRTQERKPDRGINWQASQFWYRLPVSGSGSYKIGHSALQALPDWAETSILRLFCLRKSEDDYHAEEMALYINDEEIFFSYSGENTVLWLAVGGNFIQQPLRRQELVINPRDLTQLSSFNPEIVERNRQIRCLMIRPADFFEDAAEELTEFHFQQFGVESAIVIQQDIFDLEAGGAAEPEAIRSYLENYYYENPALEYVVLLGSGTSDFTNPVAKNKIIAWRRGSVSSGITSDDFFVDFNGDDLPELSIGRIPAQSESMMNQYLGRLNYYYNEAEKGWWQNRILLIADDENKKGGLEGIGGTAMDHTSEVEEAAELLSGRNLEKVYGIEYIFDGYQNKPGASQDIIEAWNQGCLVSYYIGHGSWNKLGDEDYFTNDMIAQIENEEHLTHLIAGSCNVGDFDDVNNNCMGELILFGENGGAIASLTSTNLSSPDSNGKLLREYVDQLFNEYKTLGQALVYAKYNSNANVNNSLRYNIMGDPVLKLPVPVKMGSISGLPDSLKFRQTIEYDGNFANNRLSGSGQTMVFDSQQLIHYSNFIPPDTSTVYEVDYLRSGNTIFRGNVNLENGIYSSSFIVPDNAGTGDNGMILTRADDEDGNYLNFMDEITYVDASDSVENESPPQVMLYLNSRRFRSGDTVSDEPLLIADIADSSGINLTLNTGRNIMLLLDNSQNPEDLIDVSEGFLYLPNSHTRGTLTWKLPAMDKGWHNLKLIVYDNFGLPTVQTCDFNIKDSEKMAITKVLPYPHPMDKEGYFTFVITEDAEITISIFTISGRKIKTIKQNCLTGYNQIFWNCRDEDGDKIASNNYFYKIKAYNPQSKNSASLTEKLIILH